jgi:hypothetical protein
MKQINIEGYTPDEILRLPKDQFEAMVFAGTPLVFRAGSAEILGEFMIRDGSLVIELAQIDGGGEGVLPALGSLAQRYAKDNGIRRIEWVVHALNCAKPNAKLRRLLERRGFTVTIVEGIGEAYYLADEVNR